MNRPRLLTRRALARTVLGVASLSVLAACSSASTTPKTAPVERTTLSNGVSSTGSLSAASEQNLGFATGGQLTSVRVKVGDHVDAGQILATIDDDVARQALAAERAQLRAQEALLDKFEDSPAVDDAEDSLDQAENVLDAVNRQVAQQDNADQTAIYNAQMLVAADRTAATSAKSAQDTACAGGTSANCTSAQASYSAAVQKLVGSEGSLRAAQQKRQLDQSSGRVSIENAQQAVVVARNSADIADSDRPHTIDQQEALVAGARAAVRQAEREVTNTTLRAPVAGTVTALNGAVGEYVSASIGTSALAPGTDASIPGASGSSSSGISTGGTGVTTPARPGGGQFLVLSNVDQLQVVALFNESDAAALQQDQTVEVTFDALPDVTASGHVAAVAPGGTAVSGVISYYVTVNLDEADKRLKAGLTANVNVFTDGESDVLTVPTAAVRTANGKSAVTVLEGDKTRAVTFEKGTVSQGRTEVLSGLREGQRVVLPGGATNGGDDK